MRLLFTCCAGLDVHKKSVVACMLRTLPTGDVEKTVRHFGTMLRDLESLREWLLPAGCQVVAMESTGPYWWPVYNVLEGHLEQWVVNAYHCKNVPGRKTDVQDAEWLAELLRYGLVRPSYVPDRDQRDLRQLTRSRTDLVEERARCSQRIQQLLEDANLKLASVLSNTVGASGRAMLAAIRDGEADPEVIAKLARGRLRKRQAELVPALTGRVRPEHRFVLGQWLKQLEFLDTQIAEMSMRIDAQIARLSGIDPVTGETTHPVTAADAPAATEREEDEDKAAEVLASVPPTDPAATPAAERPCRHGLPPLEPPTYVAAVRLIDAIPGIAEGGAQTILAETGVNMRRFQNESHLTAWGGVAPGNHQSAGKRGRSRCRPGNPALRKALVRAAHGAIRTQGSFFAALYRRLVRRLGKKRATIAIARRLLIVIYHLLLYQEPYQELGSNYYDERQKEALTKGMVRRLEKLGYNVTLATAA